MDHAGKSALEVKDRDVLLMIIHLQSSSPIQFTSLKKTTIQQSSLIDALMKTVRNGAGIQAYTLNELLPSVRELDPLQYISRASSKRVLTVLERHG